MNWPIALGSNGGRSEITVLLTKHSHTPVTGILIIKNYLLPRISRHEAIFETFDRWDAHTYEFIRRDKDGIALRSYVHPQLYDWEHYIELQEALEGLLDYDPTIVDEQGTAPSQYRDL